MMARIAGALLAVDLPAAAANLFTVQGGLSALALRIQISANHGMHGRDMGLDAEDFVGKSDLADFSALHVKNFYIRHCCVLLKP